MVLTEALAFDYLKDKIIAEYEEATVYGDFEQEQILHEGEVHVMANGWVALPTGRLLSPDAVHHIDP